MIWNHFYISYFLEGLMDPLGKIKRRYLELRAGLGNICFLLQILSDSFSFFINNPPHRFQNRLFALGEKLSEKFDSPKQMFYLEKKKKVVRKWFQPISILSKMIINFWQNLFFTTWSLAVFALLQSCVRFVYILLSSSRREGGFYSLWIFFSA